MESKSNKLSPQGTLPKPGADKQSLNVVSDTSDLRQLAENLQHLQLIFGCVGVICQERTTERNAERMQGA